MSIDRLSAVAEALEGASSSRPEASQPGRGDAAAGAPRGSAPRIRTMAQLPLVLTDGREVQAEIHSFRGLRDDKEHFALKLGHPSPDRPLVRVHSECVTGDVFGSARCDCGPQLQEALRRLHDEGGYLLYLRQEGRGIGLYRKLDAYRLQERGYDTYAANRALGHRDDERDYGAAADMLAALGIRCITLLSNNPDKRVQLEAAGITVENTEPTGVFLGAHNRRYLEAKVEHTGHAIELGADGAHSTLRSLRDGGSALHSRPVPQARSSAPRNPCSTLPKGG